MNMKRFILLLSFVAGTTLVGNAQTFSFGSDTVYNTPLLGTSNDIHSDVNNLTSGNIKILWKVISSDFPTDWLGSSTGMCDNNLCYPVRSIWPGSSRQTSENYASGRGTFKLQMTLTGASSPGTHYLTIRGYNAADTTDSVTTTFAITRSTVSVPGLSRTFNEEVTLYPNPAGNDVNIVFDGYTDVNIISLYNNIGRVVAVYKVNGNSANLSLDNVPTGIYFARLVNSHGTTVATRKFTKQ
jgi:hypothetical protein